MTPDDVAELLQVPVKTLASWRTQRKGPKFARMGKYVRYRKSNVDEWIADLDNDAATWMQS